MQENGLSTSLSKENIKKLLLKYSLPSIIAMMASSLYNITDSIFIGHGVGALAISGLALTFPLMNLSAAFGSMVGLGAATLMSVRLGQKDYDTANNILGNVFTLDIIVSIAYMIVVLSFLDPILYFFGASENTLPYARDYMKIILYGNVVTHMYFGLNDILRSSGKPKLAMATIIFSIFINLILNPIFIFKFKWGIQGSAIATVTSQTIMMIWQFKILSNKKDLIHFKRGIFKLRKDIITNTFAIGLSPFLMNALACIIIISINQNLFKYGGDLAVGAYGIVNRMSFLFMMIVMGLDQGMQPITGYNYGAGFYDRVSSALRYTIILATIVMTSGMIITEIFPEAIASAFTTDKELIQLAKTGLWISFLCFPIVGFQMVTSYFFQSIGIAGKAIFLTLSRQLFFLLPLLYFLPTLWGISGVWFSLPISDFMSCILSAIILSKQLKKFKNC